MREQDGEDKEAGEESGRDIHKRPAVAFAILELTLTQLAFFVQQVPALIEISFTAFRAFLTNATPEDFADFFRCQCVDS